MIFRLSLLTRLWDGGEPLISVNSLTKLYSGSCVPAVDNLSLEVNDGEIVGFAGLNGAGKTTTMKVCVGLLF